MKHPCPESERALLERDLGIFHQVFVEEVAENRSLPVDQIQKLADGSSMPAELAWSAGLVDSLGNEETARSWFAEQLGVNTDEVVFCD